MLLPRLSWRKKPQTFTVKSGKVEHIRYKVKKHNWYDILITSSTSSNFSLQAAGRIEIDHEHNFKACTDPEMGNFSQEPELIALQNQ